MMSIIEQPACELRRRFLSGELSAREITAAFCDQIEAADPQIHALLFFDRAAALRRADDIDSQRARGRELGPLAPLPVILKDIVCTKGQPTTCASRSLENFIPPYDACVVERLDAAGAIRLAKSNLDEFAMGSSTENSCRFATRNPWDTSRVAGGSSGGSAAAVGARMTPLAIGTDTGGSIRQPAAFSGAVGLKPTYGRVSRFGLVAFASSLDQIGIIARTAEDVAMLLEVIAGHDSRDSTSVDQPVPNYCLRLAEPIRDLRIGIVPEHFSEGLDAEVASLVQSAISALANQGATIHEIELPHARFAIPAYYLVATAEASSNLARYDGVHYGLRADQFNDMVDMYASTRGQGFGAEVKRRIMLGTFALSAGYCDAYYTKALKVRRLIKQDLDMAFQHVDVIAGPVTPTAAFRIGEKTTDPLEMYLGDIYTVGANLAGIPGLSVPCGFTDAGLPVGLQLQSPPFGEENLLRVGHAYQQQTAWHMRMPPTG